MMSCSICGAKNVSGVGHHCPQGARHNARGNFFPLPAGTRLLNGVYLIESVLSATDLAITYVGRDVGERRGVVIREFFPLGCGRNARAVQVDGALSSGDYDAAKQMFLMQGRLLLPLRHPNVAYVDACFAENNTAYRVTEKVSGQSLQQLWAERAPMEEKAALYYIRQAGLGLHALHQAGLLHGDVHPNNIMVCRPVKNSAADPTAQRVVLIDFGNPPTQNNANDAATEAVSRGYAAPEQGESAAELDAQIDVYGLGATAYRLLTGEVPIDARSRMAGEVLPAPHKLNRALSRPASDAIMWAMELDRGERAASVDDFVRQLPRYLPDAISNRHAAAVEELLKQLPRHVAPATSHSNGHGATREVAVALDKPTFHSDALPLRSIPNPIAPVAPPRFAPTIALPTSPNPTTLLSTTRDVAAERSPRRTSSSATRKLSISLLGAGAVAGIIGWLGWSAVPGNVAAQPTLASPSIVVPRENSVSAETQLPLSPTQAPAESQAMKVPQEPEIANSPPVSVTPSQPVEAPPEVKIAKPSLPSISPRRATNTIRTPKARIPVKVEIADKARPRREVSARASDEGAESIRAESRAERRRRRQRQVNRDDVENRPLRRKRSRVRDLIQDVSNDRAPRRRRKIRPKRRRVNEANLPPQMGDEANLPPL